MIEMKIRVQNLDKLRRNFRRAPALTLKYLARATKAAVLEVEKNVTEGGIMQFKTPRSKRSGHLVGRWGLSDSRGFSKDGLSGYTGPSVNYAPLVYFGKHGSGPNKYIDRIAKAATPQVEHHFNNAVDIITDKLSKT